MISHAVFGVIKHWFLGVLTSAVAVLDDVAAFRKWSSQHAPKLNTDYRKTTWTNQIEIIYHFRYYINSTPFPYTRNEEYGYGKCVTRARLLSQHLRIWTGRIKWRNMHLKKLNCVLEEQGKEAHYARIQLVPKVCLISRKYAPRGSANSRSHNKQWDLEVSWVTNPMGLWLGNKPNPVP